MNWFNEYLNGKRELLFIKPTVFPIEFITESQLHSPEEYYPFYAFKFFSLADDLIINAFKQPGYRCKYF
jgi:hypothetical protein